jgi:ribonucleoside-triphosphate reductase (thioredoxin)
MAEATVEQDPYLGTTELKRYITPEWDWKKELRTNQYMSSIQKKIVTRLHDPDFQRFELDAPFVDKYRKVKPPFGFNGFGELVYKRTYSRIMPDGKNEEWVDTVNRVINGTYNLQKRWIQDRGLEWSDYKAQESAQEMFLRMFQMKFLPPGRGIWAMGSEITEERGLYAALNNCAFVSTEGIGEKLSKPFRFLMDMSMLGVGVGFDTRGAGDELIVLGADYRRGKERFVIPDTREGWVESVGRVIDSYLMGTSPVKLSYEKVRPKGELIAGFGGKSSGPEPLQELHESLEEILSKNKGRPLSSRTIVDLQNVIGKCVVAGNVRRTAEIALGDALDEEFLDLKNYQRNPERADYGWTSNNSVFGKVGMDYHEIAERIRMNGEPGVIWLDNIRRFGRMLDPEDNKDHRAKGVNPCVEQSMEDFELCNLVETFPNNHDSVDDFLRTLKFAYMYAKTVSLGETHWPETNRVLLRNRRIGASMSGVAQFVQKEGLEGLREWAEKGYKTIQHYDEVYSNWMTVPRSIKTTSVKPSGTVSSVAGATPGMHWPISEYYIRRMRVSKGSELVEPLKEAGIPIEDDFYDKSSFVVEFPVHVGEGMRSEQNVSMWEQFEMASFMQKYWADNQVSATIKFQPDLSPKELSEVERLVGRRERFSQKALENQVILSMGTDVSEDELRKEYPGALVFVDRFEKRLDGMDVILDKGRIERWGGVLEQVKDKYAIFTQHDSQRLHKLEEKAAKSEGGQIEHALNHFQYELKGISLLPNKEDAYRQLPFEPITREEYLERTKKLKQIDFSKVQKEKANVDRFCNNDTCEIVPVAGNNGNGKKAIITPLKIQSIQTEK